MENQMTIFRNPAFGAIRTIKDDKGEPWFCGKDVADALGYARADNAIRIHVDDDDKLMHQISASGQRREMVFINESGVYSLVLSSKLPQAKDFKHWVTSEVLPSIRKDGAYVMAKPGESDAEIMARGLQAAQRTILRLEAEHKALEREASYFNEVVLCKNCYTTQKIAKELGLTPQDLHTLLLQKNILFKQSKMYMLYKDYADLGLAKSRTGQKRLDDGRLITYPPYLVWTEKGRIFIHTIVKAKLSRVTRRLAIECTQPSLFSMID